MMQDLWKQVAEQYHVSAEEVQAEITKAIETGMQTAEHSVRRAWAEIPRRCDVPEPEEVVAWLVIQALAAGVLPDGAAERQDYAEKR